MTHIPYYYENDYEYANKRLSQTFVKTVNNDLVYVEQVTTDDKQPVVVGRRFSRKDSLDENALAWGLKSAVVPTKDLDMSPIDLGYVFCKRLDKAIFVSRYPLRNLYKQGLHMNSLSVSDGVREYINPSEFFSPMLNLYPSLEQASKLCKRGPWSIPFSRAFALRKDGRIEYMGRQVVGQVSEGQKIVAVLDPKFAFLQQHLDWSTK